MLSTVAKNTNVTTKNVAFIAYKYAKKPCLALLHSSLIVLSDETLPKVIIGKKSFELKPFDVSSDRVIEGVERCFFYGEIPVARLRAINQAYLRNVHEEGSIQSLAEEQNLSLAELTLLRVARDAARNLIP